MLARTQKVDFGPFKAHVSLHSTVETIQLCGLQQWRALLLLCFTTAFCRLCVAATMVLLLVWPRKLATAYAAAVVGVCSAGDGVLREAMQRWRPAGLARCYLEASSVHAQEQRVVHDAMSKQKVRLCDQTRVMSLCCSLVCVSGTYI